MIYARRAFFVFLVLLCGPMSSILIKNGTLVTVDSLNRVVRGDLLIAHGRIVALGDTDQSADVVVDASECAVIPGFVQTHIHLCQTLFRGAADDLALIDWLKQRVWPMEAAHTQASIAASARLGIAELIKGGTTCALTMETVNHTGEVFKVVEETGFRATVGKCMMDKGDEVPKPLQEETSHSIEASLALLEEWHGRADGRSRGLDCFSVCAFPNARPGTARTARRRTAYGPRCAVRYTASGSIHHAVSSGAERCCWAAAFRTTADNCSTGRKHRVVTRTTPAELR